MKLKVPHSNPQNANKNAENIPGIIKQKGNEKNTGQAAKDAKTPGDVLGDHLQDLMNIVGSLGKLKTLMTKKDREQFEKIKEMPFDEVT